MDGLMMDYQLTIAAMLRQLGIITDDELTDAGTPTVATPVP